jgi:hypothetical protein
MNFTAKEKTIIKAIISNGLEAMGGSTVEDLYGDNFSWFGVTDLTRFCDYSKETIKGVISSLDKKGIIGSDDDCWYLETDFLAKLVNGEASI